EPRNSLLEKLKTHNLKTYLVKIQSIRLIRPIRVLLNQLQHFKTSKPENLKTSKKLRLPGT
ncbi:MAG: hypothetical protein LHW58_01270, partial [Candidatus Cloacimonetes bacterium]|nr:hypothetical protein [Candidatus Cloacimonadota bacterium]MCK9179086.1 hypothetical protein [Candidatus Cloacimonadota bacterium]